MTEDDIIEEMIGSFRDLAIGDIEFNIEKPISAFILCSCLIYQLAAFRYNHGKIDNKEYYNQFIKDYLPQYRGLNLYINLRCKLVHNYTVGEHIRLTSAETIFENIGKGKNVNVINAKMLFRDLKIAFDKLCSEG